MEKILEINDLRTYFQMPEGVVKAVDGISFTVKKGEILGLVGESGCGKSVTALSILQILAPNAKIMSGDILLYKDEDNPINLAKLDPKGEDIRRIRGKDIAMIFQEPMASFSPVYTVGSQIVEAILLHEDVTEERAKEIAIEMLGVVGIPQPRQKFDAYPFELSGGMLQRAMIALALSCGPKLLIADEPTTALDVTIQAQILNLMKKLQREFDMSIILITHDMGVIAKMSDTVGVMYLGELVELAPVNELFYNPKHPYTIALLRSIPKIGERKTKLEAIQGNVPDPYNFPAGCRFHPRCPSYMKGVCENEPPEVEISAGHRTKCFLYGGK